MEDQILYCRQCARMFIFTVGEQAFYARKQLIGPPGRCADCRLARRQQRYDGRRYAGPQAGSSAYFAARRQPPFRV
ncbi:MAG TPA: zinc-ribbon domain containing protein [Ktedonobacteraceae bacterium]|nr:zinc-ribbon domain containing protein [Ktedonobacteraceae bacterium]